MSTWAIAPEVMPWFLAAVGLIAGTIDAIAGGGGLITVPALMLAVGPGADAIGTNKIAGVCAAFSAMLVYRQKQPMNWRVVIEFAISVAVGSFAGSQVSPLLPPQAFRWFLVLSGPVILAIVWNRNLWIGISRREGLNPKPVRIVIAGIACGFYDGVWGPGGGTFMLLSLLFFGDLPLIAGLVTSKFANTVSASSALIGYAWKGHVHWFLGLSLGAGACIGAWIGARFASERTAQVVRPALALVVALLLVRVLTS